MKLIYTVYSGGNRGLVRFATIQELQQWLLQAPVVKIQGATIYLDRDAYRALWDAEEKIAWLRRELGYTGGGCCGG